METGGEGSAKKSGVKLAVTADRVAGRRSEEFWGTGGTEAGRTAEGSSERFSTEHGQLAVPQECCAGRTCEWQAGALACIIAHA